MSASTEPAVTVPRARGGWWHQYVCPVHHTELQAPAGTHGDAERVYPCPHGCRLVGEPYASAWLVLEHQGNARRLRRLARRAAGGDTVAATAALDLLAAYAELYAEVSSEGWHDQAQDWMLGGKLFHQALTEALWATAIANATWTLATADGVDLTRLAAGATPLLEGLRATCRDARRVLVHERGDLASNYTAWLNAADALIGGALARLGTGEVDEASWRDGDEGLYAHVRAAVLPDGWEWEAATYYHGFVARAYLYTLRGQAPGTLPSDVALAIAAMLQVVDRLATGDGALPALHDSPYHRPSTDEDLAAEHRRAEAREVLELATLGGQFAAIPGLGRVADHALDLLPAEDHPFEHQLDDWFGGPPLPVDLRPRGSVLFADAGYAVLRPPAAEWQAVVDFGPHGGSHGHLDKLALYLYGPDTHWQPDPGVVPYGSRLRHDHYRTTAAHPTVRVDGVDQAECIGVLDAWEIDGATTRLVAHADDAYPGVSIRRLVHVDARHVVDVVEVTTDGDREVALQFRPDVDVAVTAEAGQWRTRWGGATPMQGVHLADDAVLEAVPGFGPADDPQRRRTNLDWRATGPSVRFVSVLTPGDAAAEVEVDTDAVHVRFGDHRTTVPFDPQGEVER